MFTSVFLSVDVSTFSLLVIEWKLCARTTSNLQTSKLAQLNFLIYMKNYLYFAKVQRVQNLVHV